MNVVETELQDYLNDYALTNVIDLGPIRVGLIPETPDEIGTIIGYGGLSHQERYGVVGIGYEQPSVQVLFRGQPLDYETPMVRARHAWQALASIQPGTISFQSNTEYLKVRPIQSPFSLGQDQNKRYQIVCNYLILKEPQ